MNKIEGFRKNREKLNTKILDKNHIGINRFFNLDTRAYTSGALDEKTKEFAGLAASMVLRCDDCITYHILRCKEIGATNEEIMEIFNIGLIVGGSIVIPHLRRAVDLLDECNSTENKSSI